MKLKLSLAILMIAIAIGSCSKQKDAIPKTAQVKVKIDYLGTGGYYNDNIDGVPSGLIVGTNGPFTVDPSKNYTMVYKANSNFPETSITNWSPTTDRVWVIHCYVSGNTEYIETYHE